MAPKEKEEGLDPPFLGGTSAMEFVPVLIAKLKSGSDCGIDFFFLSFFHAKVIFTGQLPAGNVLLSPYTDTKRNQHLGYLTAKIASSNFKTFFFCIKLYLF